MLRLFTMFFLVSLSLWGISDHFDGQVFYNNPPTTKKDLFDVLKWMWNREKVIDPIDRQDLTQNKPPYINNSGQILVTFVGHSTFLLQANSVNILTDPIWSERCSPVSFLGPKRFSKPGIAFEDLPKIDAVIISHNHYDHMDLPTLKNLWQRDQPVFFVPLKNKSTLSGAGIANIIELDWWESLNLRHNVEISAVPAQHWSGRWVIDRNQALWSGFVINFNDKKVFFAGDTGFGPHFNNIKAKFGDFELALLPIGAYMPRWFMQDHHLSPADAIEAAKIINARENIPMHFGTFALGDDGFGTAKNELMRLLSKDQSIRFSILNIGEHKSQ